MKSTLFLLIRHAESTWNAAGRWQGQGDPPLSPRGRRQARKLAELLSGESIDVLMSSDLHRARATAEAIGERCGLEVQAKRDFRELDVGAWTGLTRSEIAARDVEVLKAFESEDPDVRPGGGETRREIRERVREAACHAAAEHPGDRIALVTHLGTIRALVPGSQPDHGEVQRISLAEILAASRRSG
ncbi:MAG: histidine phosphatase family protein [Myxococcota bacterium]